MSPIGKNTITRYKKGDAAAFDVIFDCYSDKIYWIAFGILKDEDVAKDIVQDVFVKLWMKRDKVNPELTFDNYIFTITYNTIRSAIKKHLIRSQAIALLLKEGPEVINDTDADLVYSDLYELASSAIERLPPKRKTVYKLSKQEGMKIKEIAASMNISTRTAENHLALALKFLKEELSKYSLASLMFFYFFLN